MTAGRYRAPPASVLRHHTVAGLGVWELQRRPHERLPPHRHAEPTICLTLRGSAVDWSAAGEHTCEWPLVLFRPAGVRHANRFGPAGARTFVVAMGSSADPDLPTPDRTTIAAGLLTVLALRLHRALDLGDPLAPIQAEELRLHVSLQGGHGRRRAGEPKWLSRVIDRLEAEPTPAGLAELADLAGVHPVYLARAFRRHRRCSIGEYLRRRRLDRACRLLIEGELSLSEIAVAVGFSDQSHMSRCLVETAGQPPARLRRLLGAAAEVRRVQDGPVAAS